MLTYEISNERLCVFTYEISDDRLRQTNDRGLVVFHIMRADEQEVSLALTSISQFKSGRNGGSDTTPS